MYTVRLLGSVALTFNLFAAFSPTPASGLQKSLGAELAKVRYGRPLTLIGKRPEWRQPVAERLELNSFGASPTDAEPMSQRRR